jgi:5-methyltetrahydrofolate--homocysteine methyltransferase
MRINYASAQESRSLLSLADARAYGVPYGEHTPEKPPFLGLRRLDGFTVQGLVPFIDWTPFFHTWEMRGTADSLLKGSSRSPQAMDLKRDADALLDRVIKEGRLRVGGAYGFLNAHRDGDDVVLRGADLERYVLPMLRRQESPRSGSLRPGACPSLADFVSPAEAAGDAIGLFAVTAGIGLQALVDEFEKDHDDYNAIMAKALADRLAEALAEALHQRVRTSWYAKDESLDPAELHSEKYRGIRPAPGYAACPDHRLKGTIFELLRTVGDLDISLTESFAMLPQASVSGLYFAHPQARYFSVGRISADQVLDYSERMKEPLPETERWLAPNLGYESSVGVTC